MIQKKVYEIYFETSEYEFDITVDATSGNIIKQEKEPQENKIEQPIPQPEQEVIGTQETIITKQEAKKIVLTAASVTAKEIRKYEISIDTEDGKSYYEISFKKGSLEYEYLINALNGEIVSSDIEKD